MTLGLTLVFLAESSSAGFYDPREVFDYDVVYRLNMTANLETTPF